MASINGRGEIVVVWKYEDFNNRSLELGFNLTENKILEAMELVCNLYDANEGISWEIIDNILWEKAR